MNRQQRRAGAKLGQTSSNPAKESMGAVGPASAAAFLAEGVEHHRAGRLPQAEACYRRALAAQPDHPDGLHLLGLVALQVGRPDAAVELIGKAIKRHKQNPVYFFNFGNAKAQQGKLDDAIAAYRQAVAIKPDYAEAHSNLGNAAAYQGKLDEAMAAYRQAVAVRPDYAEAHSNLGNALTSRGKFDEAIAACRRAVAIRPDYAEAHSNLGAALASRGKLDEAAAAYRQAIRVRPDFAEAHSNLGGALTDQGKLDEAIAAYRQAIGLSADLAVANSGLLFSLNYDDKATAGRVFAEHLEWGAKFARKASQPAASASDHETGKRLRIGYVSPDLRAHSVAYFLEPLLRGHDRQAVEIFCYAEVARPDGVTARLRELSDYWLTTIGLSDDELAERIRADGVDILVDLAGHTVKNRLGVFARKPAPVQATWLGYPNTTGLDAIDYRLVDATTDPVGQADAWASETLVRLEGGFLCYGGVKDAREPAAPPSLATGVVTFGSFNNPAKLSASTLDAWARLLIRLPQARLLLKGKAFADPGARALLLARLGEHGVAAERVELVGWLPGADAHLALYDRMDVALDPFPYNGTTTTCEALWMGVPVVTLRGDRHAGRVGASLLEQIGLTDLVGQSLDDYVEIAAGLAGDPTRLAELRRSLRPRMAASPLCDGPAFAHKMEAAFRDMWRRSVEVRDNR